jgi:hypothetical protein
MLLTLGKVSVGDYGEENLVARFLLGLVFNDYSVVNIPGGKAFHQFAQRCLGLPDTPLDGKRLTATVEFQPNRCGTGGDNTTFDALLTYEDEWVWGIEAKYFDTLKAEQVQRELAAIELLRSRLGYARAGVLFLVPEQHLGSTILEDAAVRKSLVEAANQQSPCLRLATWEIVFDILSRLGPPDLGHELAAWCNLRNQNTIYSAKLSMTTRICSWRDWQEHLLNATTPSAPPPTLPRQPHGKGSFSKFGQASSTLAEVFRDGHADLAAEVVERSGFEPKAQKSGYVNLSRNGRAHAQVHPHRKGVALVVRETDPDTFHFRVLSPMPVGSLNGCCGSNKGWLEGTRITTSPAAAFLVPAALANDPDHAGWQEVDALLHHALSR